MGVTQSNMPEFMYHKSPPPPPHTRIVIGDHTMAKSRDFLLQNRITHIVNTAAEIPNYFPATFYYFKISLLDQPNEKIMDQVEQARRFIDEAYESSPDTRIFIHCQAGMSRSTTTAIYWLMGRGYSFNSAWAHVKAMRPIAQPNPGYWALLAQWSAENQKSGG